MADTDKTIENLLKAANDASGQARNAWLGFVGLIAYFFVALAGVSHRDLLLNEDVKLPIVDVTMPLFSFFLFAPFLLILVHFGLLMQHVSLSRKLSAYNAAVQDAYSVRGRSKQKQLELSREHPSRLQLYGYSISQYVAGPATSRVVKGGQWLMGWLTLNLLPVVILLFFQFQFLPYHSGLVTWLQRGALMFDLVMLVGIGMFIDRPAGKFVESLSYNFFVRPVRFALIVAGMLFVAFLSFGVATIPDSRLDHAMRTLGFCSGPPPGNRLMGCPTAWLFEGVPNRVTGRPNSLFARNIVVTDTDLVRDKNDKFAEVSHSLRGRDLRYAVLDRSDLHRVDLFGAKLQGASLVSTNLKKANLKEAKMQGADLKRAEMQGANLKRAEMEGAILFRAEMQGAILFRAKMQGANLKEATMQGADLFMAEMQGADLTLAELQGANFVGARLQGVDLRWAKMQGANLDGAELQGANLGGAELQGAVLRKAKMQGANLGGAQMQGANLFKAELQGANLFSTQLQGANLYGVQIWQVNPVKSYQIREAYLPVIFLLRYNQNSARLMLAGLKQEAVRERVKERLSRLLDPIMVAAWEGSDKSQAWKWFSRASGSDRAAVAKILTDLACDDDTGGYIIKGIARRVSDGLESNKNYTARTLVDKEPCLARKHLSEKMLARLRRIAAPE